MVDEIKNKWRTSRPGSFKNAFSGFWFNLRNEPNFRIQLLIAILVVIAGVILDLHRLQWILLVILIGVVLSAEAMNTAVEKLCDRFLEESDPRVKIIKDSAAAAVLIISAAAFLAGIFIFWPQLKELLNLITG